MATDTQHAGEPLGEFMRAVVIDPPKPRKTTVWAVLASDGSQLGIVQWNTRWRRYVFQPMEACMFDAACLVALQQFLTTKTTRHKTAGGASDGETEGVLERIPCPACNLQGAFKYGPNENCSCGGDGWLNVEGANDAH